MSPDPNEPVPDAPAGSKCLYQYNQAANEWRRIEGPTTCAGIYTGEVAVDQKQVTIDCATGEIVPESTPGGDPTPGTGLA